MPGDSQTFRNEDLVLGVPADVDPQVWNEDKYEPFLDALCGYREYQKDAIRTVLRYLAGGRFNTLRELAAWNFTRNETLQQKYSTIGGFERHLQLPDQLSGSIDLATATGKSFVLYGLSAIMLAEGLVDRVLVLCPSRTIESGLSEKFRELASNSQLSDALPPDAHIRFPSVIAATESIVEGSICIENYHAVLEHVRSSVRDSLAGKGSRTLVLNDEAHHIANAPGTEVRRWKEFLSDPTFGFRYVVGASGTCYVDDDYFTDVLARYSLRQAIEERFVKRVEYIAEMPHTSASEEKWQLIYQRHCDAKRRLESRGIKPLTIVVTRDIRSCNQVAEELVEFLTEHGGVAEGVARGSVLPVTSAREHQPNLATLRHVDEVQNPVEWIVSVAMLTEGWDAKNVFQIVPHEERAFNSKLLISQVLGRGLRRPEPWAGADPIVTVFNHDAWSGRIKHLVNEVLEIERRLTCRVIAGSDFNFDLHQLDYTRIEDVSEYAKTGEYRLFESGYVELPTQIETEDVTVGYVDAVTHHATSFRAVVQHRTWSAEEVARQMYERLRSIDEESRDAENPEDRTAYSDRFPLAACEEIVRASLERAQVTSGRVIESNRQRFLQALGTLRRRKAKRVVYTTTPSDLRVISTADRPADSASAAELRRASKTIFYTDQTQDFIVEEQLDFFNEATDPDGEFAQGQVHVANWRDFKSPLPFAIADATPERRFIRELISRQNASAMDAWLKNAPARFYTIEYSWKKGEHPKRSEFSPDFFILQNANCLFIEIKSDDELQDPAPDIAKKHQFAHAHFALLNQRLEAEGIERRYHFTMLTPRNYNTFFQTLRDGSAINFVSELDVLLRGQAEANAAVPELEETPAEG